MVRATIRFLICAAVFAFILPLIPGIDFHGNFAVAILAALVFSIVGWLVDVAAVLISGVITVTTLGFALLWLIPLWILGFWLLPAVTLKIMADLMPTYLTVKGWIPAIEGGLVLLVIGALTGERSGKRSRESEE